MRLSLFIASAALASVALCGTAFAAESMPSAVKMGNGMLMDAKGMTLYTWDNDKTPNKSSCNGMCLMNWPALKAEASDKDMAEFTVITRDDGSKQWAARNAPFCRQGYPAQLEFPPLLGWVIFRCRFCMTHHKPASPPRRGRLFVFREMLVGLSTIPKILPFRPGSE
jgi:predicted lipoprotein with Yx(FWY)xxD motif